MEFVQCFGFRVFSDHLSSIQLSSPAKVLATISPNSYGISTKDEDFRAALKHADYLVLDGVYFSLASILMNRRNIKKNQGPDVFRHFMERLNASGGKAFFLGSTDEVLQEIKSRAAVQYPDIRVDCYSPPFKPEFDDQDNRLMKERINAIEPDIVFIGLTCPKQEKWANEHKESLNTKLVCSIGAVFTWYAGKEKNIHPLWWKLRLAWLKRTIDRPEILKRYPSIFTFFWHLFLVLLGLKKIKHEQ